MRKDVKAIKASFGSRVRQIRLRSGMSQEELAFVAGLDRSYVGSVERGQRNVTLVNIHKIAAALGVAVCELFRC